MADLTKTTSTFTSTSLTLSSSLLTTPPTYLQYLIEGTPYDDYIYGNDSSNLIYGWSGNDTIYGSAGGDEIHGGSGTDTVNYYRSPSYISVDLQSGKGYRGDARGDTLVGIENITGSNYGDYIYGSSGSNVLNGRYGDDYLNGRGGNDTLIGGSGNDTLIGGYGADVLSGGSGSDTASYAGASSGVVIELSTGFKAGTDAKGDVFYSIENVTGTSYQDWLYGDAKANVLKGGAGADLLSGMAGDDKLFGGSGNDILSGGAGKDQIDGGSGIDEVTFADAARGVYVSAWSGGEYNLIDTHSQDGTVQFNDSDFGTLDHFTSIEVLAGSNHDDYLVANSSRISELKGLAGNDILFATSNHVLNGGWGVDTVNFNEQPYVSATVDLATGSYEISNSTGTVGTGQVVSIENIVGSTYKDNVLYGNGGDNVITSLGKNDYINGRNGDDTITAAKDETTVFGGNGNDHITSIGNEQYVDAGGDDDVIDVQGELSTIISGSGDDEIYIAFPNELSDWSIFEEMTTITGQYNEGSYRGWADPDYNKVFVGHTIDGGDGVDTLITPQFETVTGYYNSGAETSNKSSIEVDLAEGYLIRQGWVEIGDVDNDGATELEWQWVADSVSGIENVIGSNGSDYLVGDGATNLLYGMDGDDILRGGGNDDTLEGGLGNDVLNGGEGDDYLTGGSGADDLFGGEGFDTAFYSDAPSLFGSGVQVSLKAGVGHGGYAEGDTLTGIEGLVGSRHDDILEGDEGDNTLEGGNGNDILNGAGGVDSVTGGWGADTFRFEGDYFGTDKMTITDFETGIDQIDLRDLDVFLSEDEVFDNLHQDGANVILDYGSSELVIENVGLSSLSHDDFIF